MSMKRFLAADPLTLPNGQKVALPEFLAWWKRIRKDSSPRLRGGGSSGVTPDIMGECFGGATIGTINTGSPGPLNDWTYFPKGTGSVSFVPGLMTFDNATGTPAASRPITPTASLVDLTLQFEFTEYPAPVAARTYEWQVMSTGSGQFILIYMDESGFLGVYCGGNGSADGYSGVWTPNSGTRKVHLIVSPLNVPTIYIDDVLIPLGFDGSGFAPSSATPADTFAGILTGPTAAIQASLSNVFLSSGELPYTTVFNCP